MPVIPGLQESQQYPDNPPSTDIRPESFGRDAAALASLGGEIGSFGSKLMQARKQADETDAVANESMSYRRWFANRSMELARDNPQDYAEKLRLEMDSQQASIMERLPTGDAQRMYQSKMGGFNADAYAQALAHQAANKVEAYKTGFADRLNVAANDVAQTPVPEMMMGRMQDALKSHMYDLQKASDGDGAIFSKDYAAQLGEDAKAKMANGLMVAYSQSERGAQVGIDALDRADENGLNSALTPDQARMWRERFDTILKSKHRENSAGWSKAGQNIVSNLLSGDQEKVNIGMSEVDTHIEQGKALEKNGVITPQERQEAEITVAQAAANGALMAQMTKMPDGDFETARSLVRQQYLVELQKRGISMNTAAGHENQFEDAVHSSWARVMAERTKDRNAYIEKVWGADLPQEQDASGLPSDARIDAIQTQAGILNKDVPTNGVLSEPRRESLRTGLKLLSESDPDKAADLLQRIQASKYSRRIMDDLRDGDKLPNYIYAASFMPSRDGMRSVLTNFQSKNHSALIQQFDKLSSNDAKLFEDAVDKQMRPMSAAVAAMGPDNARISMAFRDAVKWEAVNLSREGRVGAMGRDEAIAAAYRKIVGNNFLFSGPEGKSVMMPRVVGNTVINPDGVEQQMQRIYDPATWKLWDIHPPEGNPSKMQDALRRGQWVTNSSMTGVEFWYADDAGTHKITNGLGLPVTIPFVDATIKYVRPKSISEKVTEGAMQIPRTDQTGRSMSDYENPTMDLSWIFGWGKPKQQVISADAQKTGASQVASPEAYFAPPKTDAEFNSAPVAPKYQDAPLSPEDSVRYRAPLPEVQRQRMTIIRIPGKSEFTTRTLPNGQVIGQGSMSETIVFGPRGLHYTPHIQAAERKYGLPSGLLMNLIEQESNFNSQAKSKAGAAGIAQFMPGTAKRFGINPLKPMESIDAAGKYLSAIAKTLGTKNPAAILAGYNMGEFGFKKLIKKFGSVDKALQNAPAETRDYVQKILYTRTTELPQERK